MASGWRLAAVQLVQLRAAGQAQVAEAFGVDPATIWRWDQALAADGVAGLVPARKGPRRPSKLTADVVARIRELDAAGQSLAVIAAATGVSTFSVRSALGRVPARAGSSSAVVASGLGAGGEGNGGEAGDEAIGGQGAKLEGKPKGPVPPGVTGEGKAGVGGE